MDAGECIALSIIIVQAYNYYYGWRASHSHDIVISKENGRALENGRHILKPFHSLLI